MAILVIILVGGTVLAGAVVFMLFYMIQMRSSDRISYKEIHRFIEENREAIRKLERAHRRCDGEGD